MSNTKKIIIAVLVILTIVLGGASIFIAINLSRNNNSDVSVTGFGTDVTDQYKYDIVRQVFERSTCEQVLDYTDIVNLDSATFYDLQLIIDKNERTGVEDLNSLSCAYIFPGNKYILFDIYSYYLDSEIADSAEDLYKETNDATFKTAIDERDYVNNTVKVFYGDNSNEAADTCVSNLFQHNNNFAFASAQYVNFGDCREITDDVAELEDLFSTFIQYKLLAEDR